MELEPVVEDTPAPASERPVRAAAQKAAQKREEEAEAAAKKKAASGKATAAALQKKLAAQKEAATAVEAAQKARIEELEAELLRQQVRASPRGFLRVGVKGGARDARSGVGAAQKLCHVGDERSDWRICWVRRGGRRGVGVAERGHGSGGSGSGRV